MNRRLPLAGLILVFTLVPVTRAAPPAMAQTEINHLLEFVGSSGCEFFRNGSGYDSQQAQAHLRSKYQWLAARNQINTAEDFIEKAATKSSLSGRPYEVRCGGIETMTSNRWLSDELTRYRTAQTREDCCLAASSTVRNWLSKRRLASRYGEVSELLRPAGCGAYPSWIAPASSPELSRPS